MSNDIARLEQILFDDITTYRTDFRHGEVKPPVFTVYKAKPVVMRIRPPPVKDVHTLTHWKGPVVPFHLLHKPKEIIGTNPAKPPPPCTATFEDTGRDEAQRTRPRLVMTPAVSMDDIENPRDRAILCEDMYQSTTMRSQLEVCHSYLSVKAPLPALPAKANPMVLPKLQPPMVAPEWRMESVSWDKRQLRTYCRPTDEFWRNKTPSDCGPCKETAVADTYRKLQHQTKKNILVDK